MSLLFTGLHSLYRDLLFDQAGPSKSAYQKLLNTQVERDKKSTEACEISKGNEDLCHGKVTLSFLHRPLSTIVSSCYGSWNTRFLPCMVFALLYKQRRRKALFKKGVYGNILPRGK